MCRVVSSTWIGPYLFQKVVDHGFSDYAGQPMWRFEITGKAGLRELYPSLDHAMIAAVAARWTGFRGAGGTGVGTAADWFMKMIGADERLVAVEGSDVVALAIGTAAGGSEFVGDLHSFTRRVLDDLGTAGYVLARQSTEPTV